MGSPSFEKQTEDAHKLLEKHGIPHYYENGVQRKHEWHSGWLAPLVEVLMADDMAERHQLVRNKPAHQRVAAEPAQRHFLRQQTISPLRVTDFTVL